ncbi:MAG: glycoside hydrolase family 5 protein [Limisphaerales bacterium]
MTKNKKYCLLCPALLSLMVLFACRGFAGSPTAWEEVTRMGYGINLGNCFDAPDGEGTWCHVPAQPAFFDDFKAAGFTHVRLPVTWAKHMTTKGPVSVDAKFMDRVAEVVGWAVDRRLIVVLNAHHEEWFKKDPAGQMKRFEELWRQIATRFKDVPDAFLVFEILNESDEKTITPALTTEMNERILKIIRETNPTRCVIIGATGDNGGRLVKELKVPPDDRVIATYHCYDPWFFVCGEPRNPAEAKWGSETQKAAYLRTMDPIKKWSDAGKVPIYLGEYGTSRKCDPASRSNYYGFVSSQAAARGFAQAIWDDGGDMWIYNRETHRWDTNILHSVFPPAGGVPAKSP